MKSLILTVAGQRLHSHLKTARAQLKINLGSLVSEVSLQLS